MQFDVKFSNDFYFLNIFLELPLASPLVYASLKMTETWKESVMESLLSFNCAPDNFIPGCFAGRFLFFVKMIVFKFSWDQTNSVKFWKNFFVKSKLQYFFSFVDSNATGPAINKYRGMIEPQNTPFKPNGHGLGPIKRLWMFLVRQECIQNFFIKFIFGRKAKPVNFRYLSKSTKRRVEQQPWDLCILAVVLCTT